MKRVSYKEVDLEKAFLAFFRDRLGYECVHGPNVERDYREPFDAAVVLGHLRRLNEGIPEAALTEAVRKVRDLDGASLLQKNETFTGYVQDGVSVQFNCDGETRSALVKLMDYDCPERNHFCAARQWTFVEHAERRMDIVVFVNGLPLAVFELKSPSREETDVWEAYRQLRNYTHDVPSLFHYNAFMVIGDGSTTRAGTLTSGEDRFMEWKSRDGEGVKRPPVPFDVLLEGMFQKERFLDILRNFLCYAATSGPERVKVLAAYHQYFAVKKAVESTRRAALSDGRGGVFWHTQGSGKSLSMVFYARLLQHALESPTVVVLTDRNDLDNQLFTQFSQCREFLHQEPVRADSREHLRALLKGREAHGIFFSTVQKFEMEDKALSERRNIVVIADEAHRSQYGLREKLNARTGKVTVGLARMIRHSLPNATYIGFTGTPLALKDRDTEAVFGKCVDIYDMTQAVEDGATRPVYYESRVVKLKLREHVLEEIDEAYDLLAEEADERDIERSKRELGRMESILGAPQTIDALCRDMAAHYEENRAHQLTGKAMIVAYSRRIAVDIYRRMLELRPDWHGKIGVVMTSANNDPEDWKEITGTDAHRREMAKSFKDNSSPFKLAIVVDMWLTGFDMPSLATMYVYKPMSGHNLMQAIARVNRVFGDKEGGLVVDYVGIARSLKLAMRDYTYTPRDRKNYADPDIGKTALPAFREKLERCREVLHGCDCDGFMEADAAGRAFKINTAADFLSDPERAKNKEAFLAEAFAVRQALSLCSSLAEQAERYEAAFYEAVRTLLVRIREPGRLSCREISERIGDLIRQSVQCEGVLNLFSDIRCEFSLFDPQFLREVAAMKTRNLALELLRRLFTERLRYYRRTNLVQSERFSDILTRLMNSYQNSMLSNEEVIEALLDLARTMAEARDEGKKLGLNAEEAAFYDALARPEAIKDFYDNEQLAAMARELTDSLRANRTIDWTRKARARARMRTLVKRLLKKYNYPPEGVEEALDTVIGQCELWTDAPVGETRAEW